MTDGQQATRTHSLHGTEVTSNSEPQIIKIAIMYVHVTVPQICS